MNPIVSALALGLSIVGVFIPFQAVQEPPTIRKILDVNLNLGTVRYKATGYDLRSQVIAISDSSPAPFFTVYQLHKNATALREFTLPPETVTHSKGFPVTLKGKPGFLSYPLGGSYFIWYPQLGREIFFFDNTGSFLYEKKESRYLASSKYGNYLLAIAGDQSRAELLKPDMSSIFSAEGFILNSYAVLDDKRAPFRAGLAFLNGDVVFLEKDNLQAKRFNVGSRVRNAVFGEDGIALLQLEGKDGKDELAMYKYQAGNFEKLWQNTLNADYPYKLPMSWSAGGKFGFVIGKTMAGQFFAWNVSMDGITYLGPMNQHGLAKSNFDRWRFLTATNGAILIAEDLKILFGPGGYISLFPQSARVTQFWLDQQDFWVASQANDGTKVLKAFTFRAPTPAQ